MLCHMLGWCYALADVIANFIMEDFVSYGQMLLPMKYHLSDVIAFFNVVLVGKTLHHMYNLIMTGVIAKWQDGTATFLCFDVGSCYCHVAGVITTVFLCDSICYSQVADGITTQSGWWCLVDVMTKLADGIALGSIFFMLILVLRCYTEPHPWYVADGTCQLQGW